MKAMFACLFLFANVLPAQTAPDPTSAEFKRLHSLIRPTEEESRWLEIPWMTDLWAARRLAAAEGKPIFLWEMDGHPLGCT